MSGHVNEGDEDAFVENAENFVMNLQVCIAWTYFGGCFMRYAI